MTSKKIDLLEQLKRDEQQLKLRQKELMEEIELDIHRQKLLEQSGTIIKLKTQLDILRNKIAEEKIAPNNYRLVLFNKQIEYRELCQYWQQPNNRNDYEISGRKIIEEKRQKLAAFQKEVEVNERRGTPDSFINKKEITSKEYFDNLSKCSDKTIEMVMKAQNIPKNININMVNGNFPGKTARDMLPILTTILGILDKQQKSIDKLNTILNA